MRLRYRLARLAGTALVGAVLLVAFLVPASYVTLQQTAQSEFCNSCHIMDPFYRSWEESAHAHVACIECHYEPGAVETLEGKVQALSQLAKYATRTQGTKPWAEVSDASCMRSGCHTVESLEGEIDFDGVRFDHRPHLLQTRLGGRLRCVTCHAQVVQDDHMAVAPETCFACHFMPRREVGSAGGSSECRICHEVPAEAIEVAGRPFFHAEFVGRGVSCEECHHPSVEGEGTVRAQRCRSCHGEPEILARANEPRFLHRMHVTVNKVECFECHDEIRHGLVGAVGAHVTAGGECSSCHAAQHEAAALVYAGHGAAGVEPRPSRMFATRVACEACHSGRAHGGEGGGATVAAAGEVDCIHCHGTGVHGMLAGWQMAVGGTLEGMAPLLEELGPRVGASGEARELVASARDDLALVAADGSRGAHNVAYVLAALRSGAERVDRAFAALGDEPSARAVELLPFQSAAGCSECHLGIEHTGELEVHARAFSHARHLRAAGLDCSACHAAEPHGAPAFPRAQCATCHHQETDALDPSECASCHAAQAGFVAGEIEGFEPLASGMEEKDCTVCHGEPPDVFRPQAALCALCHDEEYAEGMARWQGEVVDLRGRIERQIAELRRRGGSEGEVAAARVALALVARDGSGGVHNHELATRILADALAALEGR
jgi:nitrate/TMAO reductase-like tetraheme cytochrome c subunit